jgi:hypothetical protein
VDVIGPLPRARRLAYANLFSVLVNSDSEDDWDADGAASLPIFTRCCRTNSQAESGCAFYFEISVAGVWRDLKRTPSRKVTMLPMKT